MESLKLIARRSAFSRTQQTNRRQPVTLRRLQVIPIRFARRGCRNLTQDLDQTVVCRDLFILNKMHEKAGAVAQKM